MMGCLDDAGSTLVSNQPFIPLNEPNQRHEACLRRELSAETDAASDK
jgi:hypothetical protein